MQHFSTGLTRHKKAGLDFLVFEFPRELPNDGKLKIISKTEILGKYQISRPEIRLWLQQMKTTQRQISKFFGLVQFCLTTLLCAITFFRDCSLLYQT